MRLVKLKAMKRINGLHFTPDGRKLLAVGGAEVRMQDWAVWIDVGEMKETLRIPMHANCAAVSPDLTRIAVGAARSLWKRESSVPPVAVFDATDPTWHEDESRWRAVPAADGAAEVYGVAFAVDGKRLAISFRDEQSATPFDNRFVIAPLDERTAAVSMAHADAEESVSAVLAFSPDGTRVAVSGGLDGDREVGLIDSRTASWAGVFEPTGAATRHLLYSPGGETLAVANAKAVYLLPADSDEPEFTLPHPKQANAVAFTPDGRQILSACHDGLLRIWDAVSGQLLTRYDWGIGQTTAVAVSPDGLTAAVAGEKGQIALFDLG